MKRYFIYILIIISLVVLASAIGTTRMGNVQIDNSWGIVLRDTTTVWDDSQVPALSVPTGSPNPTITSGFGGNANLSLPYFQGGGSTNDYTWFTVQMSHKLALNYDSLYCHVHWATTTADTGSVIWQLEYTYQSINGTYTTGSIISKNSGNINPAAQWKHQITIFPGIVNNKGISSVIVCRLTRLNNNGRDTYPNNAAFLGFDIHYPINTMGSGNPNNFKP